MIYQAYSAQTNALEFFRPAVGATGRFLRLPWPIGGADWTVRRLSGALETFAALALTHKRPPFGINSVMIDGSPCEVTEEVVHRTPFATLLHFKKGFAALQPRVLLVAPMSGHFATLLRATVKTMLAEHDVYITDWHNFRDVPLSAGPFDLGDFTGHVIEFLQILGPGSHVMAVCQPCVPVLAAASLMAQDGDEAQPRSMTLMAGPIDTRINPTKVNQLALQQKIDWFEQNLIFEVPLHFPGAQRRVYPGFLQLAAFLNMNLERHLRSLDDMAEARATHDFSKLQMLNEFYEEYFAVMDLPAEFYLETVRKVFQEHHLPLGKLDLRGRRIEPRAIRRTALLTVEGERDDICGLGQTVAAQELCSGLRTYMKLHRVQTGVGHYGVFSGRRWTHEVYPVVRDLIQMTN